MEEWKLYDAEYRLMEIVWELEPLSSTELYKACLPRLGWKKSTTYTVLRKLCERRILKNENSEPKGYFYSFQDAISALEVGVIDLHDKIVVRDEHGERFETTVGRIIFNETVRKAIA